MDRGTECGPQFSLIAVLTDFDCSPLHLLGHKKEIRCYLDRSDVSILIKDAVLFDLFSNRGARPGLAFENTNNLSFGVSKDHIGMSFAEFGFKDDLGLNRVSGAFVHPRYLGSNLIPEHIAND